MKNLFIIGITSILTAFAFSKTTPSYSSLTFPEVTLYDTNTSNLDSIEQFKNKQLEIYAKKIENQYESLLVEEKKQQQLLVQIDSVDSLANSNNTLN